MGHKPLFIDYVDRNTATSFYNANYTYSLDKYSCIREFYYVHLVSNYIIFLSGIFSFLTRVLPIRYRAAHVWLGRIYILSMLWSTATSLLINNTGLPLATLISFAAVLIGLTIAWLSILIHRQRMQHRALTQAEQQILKHGIPANETLSTVIANAAAEIAARKSFRQRILSLKALHGALFFVSWFNIAGRIFASNQRGGFTCHTYPVYKPIELKEHNGARGNLTVVPESDPDYGRLPWARGNLQWGLQVILGAFAFAVVVGVIWSFVAARRARKTVDKTTESDVDIEVDS